MKMLLSHTNRMSAGRSTWAISALLLASLLLVWFLAASIVEIVYTTDTIPRRLDDLGQSLSQNQQSADTTLSHVSTLQSTMDYTRTFDALSNLLHEYDTNNGLSPADIAVLSQRLSAAAHAHANFSMRVGGLYYSTYPKDDCVAFETREIQHRVSNFCNTTTYGWVKCSSDPMTRMCATMMDGDGTPLMVSVPPLQAGTGSKPAYCSNPDATVCRSWTYGKSGYCYSAMQYLVNSVCQNEDTCCWAWRDGCVAAGYTIAWLYCGRYSF